MAKSIVNSPDISVLDFKVLLDMSLAIPQFKITNNSTVQNAANLEWIFEVVSPNGTPIHTGNFTTPDVDGVAFTVYTLSEPLPKVMGQLEFSKVNKYSVKVSVRDSNSNVFDLTKASSICAPNGNNGKNNFGAANINIEVKCGQGQLYAKDQTNLIYKSLVGTKVSTTATLTYPRDANDNVLAPVTVNTLPALLPIKNEGKGHEFYAAHIFDYDLGDFFIVRVRYSFRKVFAVWCNITLQPLLCEVTKLTEGLKADCSDNLEKREKFQKLTLANTYILEVYTAIIQPLSFPGYDAAKKIEEIKELLGIECDCCRPEGISSVGSVLVTDAVFNVNKVCGDMLMSWTNDGNGNITLNYQNATYTFNVSGSEAFEFEMDTSNPCVKAVVLNVDMAVLTSDVLLTIQNSNEFLTLLSNLTNKQIKCSGLDGKNVIDITACNYTVQVGSKANDSIITGIYIDGELLPAPANLSVDNDTDIEDWLNSLGDENYTAVYDGNTDKTTITSTDNEKLLSSIYVATNGNTVPVLFSSNCTFICTIIQKIIDFLDSINLINIKTGSILNVCGLDNNGGLTVKEFADNENMQTVALYIVNTWCQTLAYIRPRLLSCANLKSIFATFTNATPNPTAGDIVFMVVNGVCQEVPLKNLALSIFGLLSSDVDVKAVYCNVSKCENVGDCSSVSGLAASVGDTSANVSWSAVVGAVGYKWSIDGINYTQIAGTTVNVTGLTVDTAYTFRVYPVYNSGDGVSCQITLAFTTTDAGAACEAPDNLVLNFVTDTSFMAQWSAVTSATGYQYRLNGGSWINIGTLLFVSLTGLTPDTTYNFEVRAIIGGNPCAEIATDSVDTSAANSYTISYSNNDTDADPISVKIGNNNTTPTTDVYNGSYDTDPVTGVDAVNLPAVNANVLLTVTGKIITSCSCNGIPGPTGAASATWGGVNGALIINFTTN